MNVYTQSEWLSALRAPLADLLDNAPHADQLDTDAVRRAAVSVGFPAQGSRHGNAHLGVAVYTADKSPTGTPQVFIDPRTTETDQAALSLLIGAAMLSASHLPNQAPVADWLQLGTGYGGQATDTLRAVLGAITEPYGAYPAAGLTLPPHVPQKGRMIKFTCTECDWQAYTSRKQLERINADAACPCCGTPSALIIP